MNTSSTAASFMPATANDIRQTEVDEQVNRIGDITQDIDKLLIDLEDKLSKSILAQRQDVAGVSGQSSPEPVRVPLASTLCARADHLSELRSRLGSILGRIEA